MRSDRLYPCTKCVEEGDETPKQIAKGYGSRLSPTAEVLCIYHDNKRKWEAKVGNKPKYTAQTDKSKEDQRKDRELNEELWEERPHICEECDGKLIFNGFPPKYVFSHLMSKGSHPELRWNPRNVVFHHMKCHRTWETGDRYQTNTWKKNKEWLQSNGYKPL